MYKFIISLVVVVICTSSLISGRYVPEDSDVTDAMKSAFHRGFERFGRQRQVENPIVEKGIKSTPEAESVTLGMKNSFLRGSERFGSPHQVKNENPKPLLAEEPKPTLQDKPVLNEVNIGTPVTKPVVVVPIVQRKKRTGIC